MSSSSHASPSEQELVDAAQRGELEAFNLLILRYQNLLFRIAFRVMHDEDAAADALQEALLSAFGRFHTFRGGSLRSWLARVTINACYDELRHRRRRCTVPLENLNSEGEAVESGYWLVDSSAGPEDCHDARELDRAIQDSLGALPPIYRTVLILVDVEGLSYEEAANSAGVPVGTVKSRLARARLQVRTALQAVGELLPAQHRFELTASA